MKKLIITLVIFLSLLSTSVLALNIEKNGPTMFTPDRSEHIMLDSPLFTKKESYETFKQIDVDMEADGFKKASKFNNLEMYYNSKTAAIRVKNLNNGYVWSTDLLDVDNPKYNLNRVQKRLAKAGFEVNYVDEKGKASTISKYAGDGSTNVLAFVNGNTIKFEVEIPNLNIKFKYSVTLNENGLNLKLDHESIVEKGKYFITEIQFFPYFGATFKSDTPGYIFIPSGNGALIRYDNEIAIGKSYKEKYFGVDANRTQNEERDPLSLPVFGVVHGVNSNAMFTEIESGAEIASLNFDPSSTKLGFNRIFNSFSFRETYMITIPGTETTVTMVPKTVYPANIDVNFSFLENDEASYIGMAKYYQNKLIKDQILTRDNSSASNKVNIDILGGETKSGIILDKVVKMTTTKDILNIDKVLKENVNNEILYTLRGFNKGGLSKHNFNNYKFNSKFGSLRDLEGLDYYIYYNPVESYSAKNKAPRNSLVNVFNSQFVVVVENKQKYKFYNGTKFVNEGMNNALDKYDNIYLDGITSKLYGDGKLELSRTEVLNQYTSLVDRKMPMVRPNVYFYKNTSAYLNMPIYHSKLRFVTDSVPFTQILLRGYIDYYSPYLNFSTNQEIDFLKAIEYGSNLSYLISENESYELANTLSSHLYATHFNSNKEVIFNQIKSANNVLNEIKGKCIVDREVLGVGLTKVVYESGVTVYINYNSTEKTVNDITVPKLGYRVVK